MKLLESNGGPHPYQESRAASHCAYSKGQFAPPAAVTAIAAVPSSAVGFRVFRDLRRPSDGPTGEVFGDTPASAQAVLGGARLS